MTKYKIVTTSGVTINLIAEDFERNQQLGRLAFRIGDYNVAMFELSNIVGFYTAAQDVEDGEPRIITHYDEIHAMNAEELASWLCDIAGWLPEYEGRPHPILEWLRQEVDDGEN